MKKPLIYAVEDDEGIKELYKYALNNESFECQIFENSEDMLSTLNERICDLIILDIMLPTIDGFQTLSLLQKSTYSSVPVIIVSAKDTEMSKVKGLDMGANDYLAKPFGILELIARIKANLKKTHSETNTISYGDINLKLDNYQAYIGERKIILTSKEYGLLYTLMLNYGKALSRDEILNKVWGYDYFGETRTVDMHIKTLRNKIARITSKEYIHTIRSIGYIFEVRDS